MEKWDLNFRMDGWNVQQTIVNLNKLSEATSGDWMPRSTYTMSNTNDHSVYKTLPSTEFSHPQLGLISPTLEIHQSRTTTMSTTAKACAPAPLIKGEAPTPSDVGHAVMSKKLWPVGETLTLFFLDGTANQKAAVLKTIAIWSTFANISFAEAPRDTAKIRVSFKTQGSWSAVGMDALKVTDKNSPTIGLGWIADDPNPSQEDAGIVLHEFGHALGMMHEHQSPLRGGMIHLKERAVYNYYRPLLNYNDNLVKSQIIDQYNLSTISNYSQLDLNSIMMYFMPADLNEEGIEVPVNTCLSKHDQAFITLNYPRKEPGPGGMPIKHALAIADVNKETSTEILDLVNNGKYLDARKKFSEYNMSVTHLKDINKDFLNSVFPVDSDSAYGIQSGIKDTMSSVVQNPLFQSVVKGIVQQVLIYHDVGNVTGPKSGEKDVLQVIGSVITNPTFGRAVKQMNDQYFPKKESELEIHSSESESDELGGDFILSSHDCDESAPIDHICLYRPMLKAGVTAKK
ncbi:hypothetical protein D9758_010354 [Tetrapyrgos nigripes]|uniref:Peptidase metallopeptidase domain-containing protein n=1 Tax=Tetrapyrgos nigripes TaxID=182062 RepID=A0A8H5D123_9AGAR|nr:hypothetical protein D9758_010354 [Tetrapyrgos nigripes]